MIHIDERDDRKDAREGPISPSLAIIDGLHARLVDMLNRLPGASWQRTGHHPEADQHISVQTIATTLAWHGEHHLMLIKQALEKRIDPKADQ